MLLRGPMHLRRISFAFALLFAFQCAFGQNQALLQKRQRELRDQSEQTTRGIRELPGTFKLRDVLDVRADKKTWKLTTNMPRQERTPVRLKIDGLEGVNVLTMNLPEKTRTPDTFTFTNTNFSDPRAVQVATHLTLNYGGTLIIGRYAQLIDGYHNVTLNQGSVFEIGSAKD